MMIVVVLVVDFEERLMMMRVWKSGGSLGEKELVRDEEIWWVVWYRILYGLVG